MNLKRLNAILDERIELSGIDLGKTYDSAPLVAPVQNQPKTYYPSFYIDREDDALDDLPDEGEAKIKYKVRSRSKSEYDGKKSRSVTIDVLNIEPEEEDDCECDSKELASQIVGGLHELALISRTRDDMGRFQANQTGGADPLTMKQAYAPKLKSAAKTAGLMAAGAGMAKLGPGMIQSATRVVRQKVGDGLGRVIATGKVATNKMSKLRRRAEDPG